MLTWYAFPELGERRVDQIDTSEFVRLLSPIWLTKPETARRVRQRIDTILDWSKASGLRDGKKSDCWGWERVAQDRPSAHHKSIPYNEVPTRAQFATFGDDFNLITGASHETNYTHLPTVSHSAPFEPERR